MRLLADENIHLETVRALRAAGHDVFSATESASGASDEALLARANTEGMLLLTFDRDFGELAAARGKAAGGGILYLRIVPESASEATDLLCELLARRDIEWTARITVVDRTQLRQRPL